MPPITSSRPGARLTRMGLPSAKSARSSARTRANRVWTGSMSGSAGGRAVLATKLLLTLRFDDELIEQPPGRPRRGRGGRGRCHGRRLRGGRRRVQVELGGQHVILLRGNLREMKLKRVCPQGGIPMLLLLFARIQLRDPGLRQPPPL